jgi:uroporphyrinogen-III synthase
MEVTMNQNPWIVEQMAAYRRRQIQEDMHQIRLAEKALKHDYTAVPSPKAHRAGSPLLKQGRLPLLKALLAMFF